MGFADVMQNAMDVSRKITLSAPITLEELFDILSKDAAQKGYQEPKFKKGLLGKGIEYPKEHRTTIRVTAKGNVVNITKAFDNSSSSVSVGGMKFNTSKDMRGGNAAKTVDAGSEYFKTICAHIEEALAGK